MKILLQLLALAAGIGLIMGWRHLAWGPASLMGGVFFITISALTALIDLANVPGFWQPFLRSPWFAVIAIVLVLGLIAATVITAVLRNIGLL